MWVGVGGSAMRTARPLHTAHTGTRHRGAHRRHYSPGYLSEDPLLVYMPPAARTLALSSSSIPLSSMSTSALPSLLYLYRGTAPLAWEATKAFSAPVICSPGVVCGSSSLCTIFLFHLFTLAFYYKDTIIKQTKEFPLFTHGFRKNGECFLLLGPPLQLSQINIFFPRLPSVISRFVNSATSPPPSTPHSL